MIPRLFATVGVGRDQAMARKTSGSKERANWDSPYHGRRQDNKTMAIDPYTQKSSFMAFFTSHQRIQHSLAKVVYFMRQVTNKTN